MDDIEILRQIGRGSFGTVFLCQDKISNEQFVIKKPRSIETNLYREISIHFKMRHNQNISDYHHLYNDGEDICIAMEYLPEVFTHQYCLIKIGRAHV